ncbi:MAG: type II toxin-antitoxin system Phd/YefM family antitoxin [Zoogloeaceae bacterium]|nr:type II toxin-antitoxin system Phd/YefM family antitoxin [Zoogloeaceae bacterium]
MEQINIYEAKTHFSKFVEQAESGEDVIIARGGKPVARLTSIAQEKPPIRFGVLKGKLQVSADFDEALPDAVLAGFEGR